MARTRKAKVKIEKASVNEMLEIVAKATDDGFMTPFAILLALSSDRQVANMFDDGLIEIVPFYQGIAYGITDKGRQTIVAEQVINSESVPTFWKEMVVGLPEGAIINVLYGRKRTVIRFCYPGKQDDYALLHTRESGTNEFLFTSYPYIKKLVSAKGAK